MTSNFLRRVRRYVAQRMGTGTELNFIDRRTRQLSFTYGFSFIGALTIIAYGWRYIMHGNSSHAIIDFAFGIFALGNLLWLRRHQKLSTATGAILLLMIGLTGYLFATGGLAGTGFLWIFTIPILAFFLEGVRRGIGWVALTFLEILVIWMLQAAGYITTSYNNSAYEQILTGLAVISLMILLFEQITERYESELQRQGHELEKFKLVADQSTDGVIMTDRQANIIYVNRAWEQLTGYNFDEVRGKNPSLIKSDKTPPAEHRRMLKALTDGRTFSSELFVNRRKDGRLYNAQVHFFPISQDKHNMFYVQLQQDITERTSIDRAKTEFVSLATHQLTTPLSAVQWFSELLLDGSAGKLPAKQRHLVERIDQSSKRMVGLVNALLNSSRVDLGTFAIHPQSVHPGRIVTEVIDEIQATNATGPKIKKTVQVKMPKVSLDPNLFRIIIQNLVTNAIRYTPARGKVDVEFRRERSSLVLIVRDTGIGIPVNAQSKMFTKLFRATNAQQSAPNGNGLGLYIVKAILDAVGGKISFSSTEGHGTTFTVTIPAAGMRAKEGNRELSSSF